jgi:hypothetical protein
MQSTVCFVLVPSQLSTLGRSFVGLRKNSPDEEVEEALEDSEGHAEELRVRSAEAERILDQKVVERVETADDQGLAQDHHKQKPRQRISKELPSLLRPEDLLLDTLVVLSHTLNKLDFVFG